MKITKINKYLTPYGIIEFFPLENTPGFTHFIAVNGARDPGLYLSAKNKPSAKTAKFFALMIKARNEGKEQYYYTDKV